PTRSSATRASPRRTLGGKPRSSACPVPPRRWAMLEVEGLSTDYGPVRAVNEVSLTVPKGSVIAVLGANGAGKTSLLRTISGLVPASAGRVRLNGQDITTLPVEAIVRRGLAHVPEGR